MKFVSRFLSGVYCSIFGHRWTHKDCNLLHYDREEWLECVRCGEEEDLYP